jgi:hypothetical protein
MFFAVETNAGLWYQRVRISIHVCPTLITFTCYLSVLIIFPPLWRYKLILCARETTSSNT